MFRWLPAIFRGLLSCIVSGAILGVVAMCPLGGLVGRGTMAEHLVGIAVWGLAIGVGVWETHAARPKT